MVHLLPESRASRVFLALSLLIHALLISPLTVPMVRRGSPVPPPAARQEMVFHFVDPQPVPEAAPEEPSPLLSSRSSRAAQPEAPADLAPGAAFQEGQVEAPVTPRPAGQPRASQPARQRPAEARPAAADSRPEPVESGAEPMPSTARTDPRLAIPRRPIDLSDAVAAAPAGERLPAPQVDQRLTRAVSGADFSLNTTAWDYGPYMERLKARIEEHINPPVAFYYGIAAWSTRVRFRIARDGRLMELTLIDHRGVEDLQYVALDAVNGAAEYEPLPPGFPESYLEIIGGFYFNVLPRRTPGDGGS